MKLPDSLVSMSSDELDVVDDYYSQAHTMKELRDAVLATREHRSGISIPEVAAIIRTVFDEQEVAVLVSELTK